MKAIGIDIGGTFIKGAICDGALLLQRTKSPTNAGSGREAVIKSLFSVLDELLPLADENSPIGVATAGDVNPYTGEIVYATDTLPGFTGLKLGELVSDYTNRRVSVVNDADGALIGEMEYGAARGKSDAVLLTLGTGLGSGIAVNGKILTGTNFRAARMGHITLYPRGRKCTCGGSGCAEQYVSATGLIKTASQYGLDIKSDEPDRLFNLALAGDSAAVRALSEFLYDLSLVVMTAVNIFDPQIILIGGGLVQIKDLWWDKLIDILPDEARERVAPAALGNSAGVAGATIAEKYIIRNSQ